MAKGKRIPGELIDEIDKLRVSYRPPQIIEIMKGRVSPRSVYRILQRLRLADEERVKEAIEKGRRMYELEEQRRRERIRSRGVRKYTRVSQFPANLRKVRGS